MKVAQLIGAIVRVAGVVSSIPARGIIGFSPRFTVTHNSNHSGILKIQIPSTCHPSEKKQTHILGDENWSIQLPNFYNIFIFKNAEKDHVHIHWEPLLWPAGCPPREPSSKAPGYSIRLDNSASRSQTLPFIVLCHSKRSKLKLVTGSRAPPGFPSATEGEPAVNLPETGTLS